MFWKKKLPMRDASATLCIVTPVLNGISYIDDAIESVLSQSGNFAIYYHIQDGGSTDGTVERIRVWQALSRKFPSRCRRLVFTTNSEPDGGMYDAINKGFARALPSDREVLMGWLAADDRLAPGAFATLVGIRAHCPEVRFVGGRVSLLNEAGSIVDIKPLLPFSRYCMAAGLYDGRVMHFVMQEGSFWSSELWHQVGGLDVRFRVAGDWDLWRRFAHHADYVQADTVLGFHRRRPGQLSSHMDHYYREVDSALDQPVGAESAGILLSTGRERLAPSHAALTLRDVYHHMASRYVELQTNPAAFRAEGHDCFFVRYNSQEQRWQRFGGLGVPRPAREIVTSDGPFRAYLVSALSGLGAPEGPYPEFGIAGFARRLTMPSAEGEVTLARSSRVRIVATCRIWTPDQHVTISANGKALARLVVEPCGHDSDIDLVAEGSLAGGRHVLKLTVERSSGQDTQILLLEWKVEVLPGDADPDIIDKGLEPVGEEP